MKRTLPIASQRGEGREDCDAQGHGRCGCADGSADDGGVARRGIRRTKYPDLSGQWRKPPGNGNQWDQTKPLGLAQKPPLTPEYQAVFEASMADQREGGQGNDPPSRCV